jgi:ABC-type amino acid transport substrate-binding protein
MKKLVRILVFVLALGMLFALAGCSGKVGDGDDAVLSMATNAAFPPYEFYEGDNIVGIDAEIAQAIADKLGMRLEIQDMEFGSIISAVQSGKVDIGMAGMTVTETRLKSVQFSSSYATGIQVIIVREGSEITSVDDLYAEGKEYAIGVQQDTTGDIYMSDDIDNYELNHTMERYNKGADAIQALVSGKVDCVIIDNEPAKAFVSANAGLVILETEYIEEEYAIAMHKKNSKLLDSINGALEELIAEGTVKEIVDKYISAD